MSDGSSLNHTHSVTVLKAGFLAVLVNLLLTGFKMTVGLLSNSVAITSDALHGLIDTISGFVVIISEKIGSVKRIKLSHEKIERIGAVFIALIILMVGCCTIFNFSSFDLANKYRVLCEPYNLDSYN